MRTTKAMRGMLTAVLVPAFGFVGAIPAVGLQDGGNGYLLMDGEDLPPGDGLLVSLLSTDDAGRQIEHYNGVGHVALHDAIEGGAVDTETADATFTQPTPVVVETAVDPRP